jgi:DNA repair exonuclease SbcCD nuclease subunit
MLTVINDLHIGTNRSAGTTPASAYALRNYILSEYANLLPDTDVLINGDLFDTFAIPTEDLLKAYMITCSWLGKGFKLWLSIGNHDLSKDSSKLSSFHLFSKLLANRFPEQVFMVDKPIEFEYGYIIPHVLNQDLLDAELLKVPKCATLFLHCNYENNFATQSDHSLNITKDQVDALQVDEVVIAHEHQKRKIGKVSIPGNQVATSISDWLNCNGKFYWKNSELVQWSGRKDYAELDWRNPQDTDARFIRFVGHAKPEEAADMASVVAAYRRQSDAFIVSNAITVGENADLADLNLASLETLKAFDVMGALKEYLTEDEYKKVSEL